VLWHAHGFVEPLDPGSFHFKKERERLAASSAFPGWNLTDGLHIKPIKRTVDDIERVAVYMADPFHQLKLRYPHPTLPGRLTMRGTRSNYGSKIILRGTEMQSHLSVYDAVLGIGALGAELRGEWARLVHAWERRRQRKFMIVEGPASVDGLWRRIHAANPQLGFAPCRIVTRSSAYLAKTRATS
jgi:hypothetical protein